MSSTDTYYWTGMCKWAQVINPDRYDKYSIAFYPASDEDRKAIKATGIRSQMKEDDDGFYFTFRNDPAKVRRPDEKLRVLNKDDEPFEGIIGNGSTVTVKLKVDHFVSREHGDVVRGTLVAVRVEDLVEYVPDDDLEDEKPKGSSETALDDAIPF